MIQYKYKAKNLQGQVTEGTYGAVHLEELKTYLRNKGTYLVDYKVMSSSKDLGSFSKVRLKELSLFCRQFAVLFQSGVNISEAIHILQIQAKKKNMVSCLEDMYQAIRQGKMLSEAMNEHPKEFPEFLRSMVKVGEVSGNLDVVMNRMAEYYEKNNKIANKVKSAMVYPMILGVLMIGVLIILFTFVLPIFAGTLEGFGSELPMITKVLLGISRVFKEQFIVISLLVVSIIGLTIIYLRTPAGKLRLDKLKLSIPVLGGVNRKVMTARFARSLGILLNSGISMLDAIDIIGNLLGNSFIKERFEECKEDVKKGYELSKALKKVGYFTPLIIEMISVGQKTGDLDDMLNRTADFFDSEVEQSITRATTLIEPIMIVIMAIMVGIIMAGVMLPMLEMMEGAMNSM